MTGRRYVACACSAVYERTITPLHSHAKGVFHCACGAELGAWTGIDALRYVLVEAPEGAVVARRRKSVALAH